MNLPLDSGESRQWVATNLHSLLGLTMPLGAPANLASVVGIQVTLIDAAGNRVQLPATQSGTDRMTSLCTDYFSHSQDPLVGGPGVAFNQDIAGRVYAIGQPTTFMAQPLGAEKQRRWLFRRVQGPNKSKESPETPSVGEKTSLRRIVVRTSPRAAPELLVAFKQASLLELAIRAGGSVLLRRYRGNATVGPVASQAGAPIGISTRSICRVGRTGQSIRSRLWTLRIGMVMK